MVCRAPQQKARTSAMGSGVVELQRNSTNWAKAVGEIVKMERKIFPKHESLASSFAEELKKKNSGLIYVELDGEVVGYVMYSWPSSLFASIAKLAGSNSTPLCSFAPSTILFYQYSLFTRNNKLKEEVSNCILFS